MQAVSSAIIFLMHIKNKNCQLINNNMHIFNQNQGKVANATMSSMTSQTF